MMKSKSVVYVLPVLSVSRRNRKLQNEIAA